MYSNLKIFDCGANSNLAESIAEKLEIPLGKAELKEFSNKESFVRVLENVRGSDVFIIQPTCVPVNDNIMKLLIMIDAVRRASARRITCVIPYYGYARTDKKDQPRVPITAKLLANIITTAGADRIIALDLHSDQIQGFFDIPVDHLNALKIFARYFQSKYENVSDLVVVSPDSGGAARARKLAQQLKCGLAVGDKRRIDNNDNTEVLNVIGDVKNKTAILYDDIIDTGGTLIKVAEKLKKLGAKEVCAACVHGVLSGNAVKKIEESPLDRLYVTDSVNLENKTNKKIVPVSVSNLLAQAIRRVHNEESISSLYL